MADEKPLRLGVIGLGQRWQKRYRPALRRLKSLFRIVAVTDPMQQLAAREAKKLECTQARGVVELVRHEGVDAVLLADAQWYGLWPVLVATGHARPVLCGAFPSEAGWTAFAASTRGAEFLTDCQERDTDRAMRIMADLPLRSGAMAAALRELCATELGKVHQVLCVHGRRGVAVDGEPLADLFPSDYLDLCLQILGADPRCFLATGLPDGSLTNLLVETTDGRVVQLTRCSGARKAFCRLDLIGEKGRAVAEFPGQLRWCGAGGNWSRRLPVAESPCRQLLREFHRRVVAGEAMRPTLADAWRAGRWQQLAITSWKRGVWTEVETAK